MKHSPIIFSTPMVQAILEGRKTQTRRVVKLSKHPLDSVMQSEVLAGNFINFNLGSEFFPCPYGMPGDQLWVRETWGHEYGGGYLYRASHGHVTPGDYKWRPSIHMPREASRITLEIKSLRVERLQEISKEDAIKEGVFFNDILDGWQTDANGRNFHGSDPRISFESNV